MREGHPMMCPSKPVVIFSLPAPVSPRGEQSVIEMTSPFRASHYLYNRFLQILCTIFSTAMEMTMSIIVEDIRYDLNEADILLCHKPNVFTNPFRTIRGNDKSEPSLAVSSRTSSYPHDMIQNPPCLSACPRCTQRERSCW